MKGSDVKQDDARGERSNLGKLGYRTLDQYGMTAKGKLESSRETGSQIIAFGLLPHGHRKMAVIIISDLYFLAKKNTMPILLTAL